MSGMTYFITGGAGFIGYHICKELLKDARNKIIIYDAQKHYIPLSESKWLFYQGYRIKNLQSDRVVLIRGDTTDRGLLREQLEKYKPNIIIHLAALAVADVSTRYPEEAKRSILDGTIILLDVLREVDSIDRFVYVSSSMAYGNFMLDKDKKIIPAKEQQQCNPIDLYGAMKLSGEYLTKAYHSRFGFPYTIIRPSAVYGPTDCNRRVTEIFLRRCFEGKPLILENGGYQQLDLTYVTDLAKGFILAATSEKGENQTFNLTRGEGRTIRELASVIAGLVPNTKIEERKAEVYRPARGTLDITKAKTLLGYSPSYSLEEGMRKYVEFMKRVEKISL